MEFILYLLALALSLAWWQYVILIVVAFYIWARSCEYYENSSSKGIKKGYMEVIFGYSKSFKIYHVFLIIVDIIPAILGLCFPFIKKIFNVKIYEFAPEEKETYRYLITLKPDLIRVCKVASNTMDPDFENNLYHNLWRNIELCDMDNSEIKVGTILAINEFDAITDFAMTHNIDTKYLNAYKMYSKY